MQIATVIQITKDERKVFEQAVNPIRLIDPTGDQTQAINRIIENKWVQVEWVVGFLTVLAELRVKLASESNVKADPKWVKQSADALEAGKMPLVKHPEQAVAMLCDIRKGQVEDVDKAIIVVRKAINMIASAKDTIDQINANENRGASA